MKSQSILVALVGILLGLITSVILNKNTVDNLYEFSIPIGTGYSLI